jgi:hypothetical protein
MLSAGKLREAAMRSRLFRTLSFVTVTALGAASAWTLVPHAAGEQTVPMDPGRAAYMREHFAEVMTAHTAVIRGDLAAAASAAKSLADREGWPSLPGGAAPHVAAMRQAAGEAAKAQDILSVAYATALMLNVCGDCHRAVGTMPAAPLAPRTELGGVVGHMLEHQRAADQLLQGLVIPSNSLWRAGAEALVGAPVNPRDLPVDSTARRELMATEERIHRLATQAVQVTDSRARASFYGQFLAGCADCHKRHPKVWGPPPR